MFSVNPDLAILEQAQAVCSIHSVKDLALFARQERLDRADFGRGVLPLGFHRLFEGDTFGKPLEEIIEKSALLRASQS